MEAVCDYVIVLGSGKLLAEGKIQELKQVHEQMFEVRLKADTGPFAAAARRAGLHDRRSATMCCVVRIPGGRVAADAVGSGGRPRASRSATCGRSAARSKKCSSTPWSEAVMPIFDQGYQHWSGAARRATPGAGWRSRGTACASALAGRSIRLVLFVAVAARARAGVRACLWGLLERKSDADHVDHAAAAAFSIPRSWPARGPIASKSGRSASAISWHVELCFSMVLILLVGPNLISQDLRYNALPLYFSRPLRRIDYFLGKLGVIVALLGAVIIVPSIVAYVLGLLFSLDITIVRDTFRILLASVAYGLVIALSAGLLILALSSLSRNSRYVALFWLGIWFVTGTVSGVLRWST